MSNAKPASQLAVNDVIVYRRPGKSTLHLKVTSGPWVDKRDPGCVSIFTDNIGVLAAMTFGADEVVEVA